MVFVPNFTHLDVVVLIHAPSPFPDWRGKSNGGHIRGTNYLTFPRFRLMDLAALPENRPKGFFDVRILQWHEWHCIDNCDPDPIRAKYNITGRPTASKKRGGSSRIES
ncbi:hypothetical protein C8R45DRAFT_1114750 [Mycena sanguinolenta]|nr:hypothetical protein C8R45DRAFT_1114750 [Mycena sanguinolenta]